jgi:serine/threonine protein phosphatase 1
MFVIGDIHGCSQMLRDLIGLIAADRKKDTLVFIGDYIDRGSASRDVVDYVLQLKKEFKKIICLLGNHEQMLLSYLEGVDEEAYLYNGGKSTLSDYGISPSESPQDKKKKIPEAHMLFFQSLLPYYQTKNYIFAHAGLVPGISLDKQSINDLLWVRYKFIDSNYDFGRRVIFGHTPMSNPLIMANKIGIDTGAVYGGKLTCLELPEAKIYQV